jgi:hypothetical protein
MSVYMEHPDTGGTASFPDEPGVVDWYEGHGWKKADEPEPVPFMPSPGDAPPADEWVELTHPATGAMHEFPNNPEALEGAYETGWEHPKPPEAEKPAKAAKKSASVAPATDNDEDKGVTTSG